MLKLAAGVCIVALLATALWGFNDYAHAHAQAESQRAQVKAIVKAARQGDKQIRKTEQQTWVGMEQGLSIMAKQR